MDINDNQSYYEQFQYATNQKKKCQQDFHH